MVADIRDSWIEHLTIQGTDEKYAKVVLLFAGSHGRAERDFTTALSLTDYSTTKRVAHTLKGSAGMIGANGIAEAAACLYSAIALSAVISEIDTAGEALFGEVTLLSGSIRHATGAFSDDLRHSPE